MSEECEHEELTQGTVCPTCGDDLLCDSCNKMPCLCDYYYDSYRESLLEGRDE